MAALTQDKLYCGSETRGHGRRYRVAAGVQIFQHAMVCVNADGFAVPAQDVAGFSEALGRADDSVDNTAGADGAKEVIVREGDVYELSTPVGTDAVTQALVGRACFVLDDQTVVTQAGATNEIRAGRVMAIVNANTVKVRVG